MAGGFKVLEFNCRFGDQETQVLLPLLKTDIAWADHVVSHGNLDYLTINMRKEFAAGVVLASEGYPGKYKTGEEIHGLDKIIGNNEVLVFHAGTKREGNKTLTNGGRVLTVVSLDNSSLEKAMQKTYGVIGPNGIHFDNIHYRKDIAVLPQ